MCYVIPAAATDHRINAVATVSAADTGRQFHEDADGSQDPAIVQGMIDAAARTAEACGEGVGTCQSSCTGTRVRATSTS
jgi:uncharacterized protein